MRTPPMQIAIFGQYKTGTTALFYQILSALPTDPTTLFEPKRYSPALDAPATVLAKVILGLSDGPNAVNYEDFLNFSHKILISRDPRDRIVSGTLFIIQQTPRIYNSTDNLTQVLDLLRKKQHDPRSISLVQILGEVLRLADGKSLSEVAAEMRAHHQWIFDFETRLGDHSLLKYEDFVDGRLQPLEQYLNLGLQPNVQVDSVHDHVIRTRKYGDWKNWFLEEDVAFFKPVTEQYLAHFGYPEDWETSENPQIPSTHAVDYVRKTVRYRTGG